MASGGIDKEIFLWDVASGKIIKKLQGHRDTITDLKFLPDQNFLVSGSEDRSIKIWNINTGELVRTIVELNNFADFAENIIILNNKDFLVSGGRDSIIRIWNYKTGEKIGQIKAHYDEIRSLILLPPEDLIISGSDDGTVRVFDIETMKQLQVFEGHTGFVTSCCVIIDYDSTKLVDTSEIQRKMFEGDFPDYYTYLKAEKRGIITFDEFTRSYKVRPSSKRKAKAKIIPSVFEESLEIQADDIDQILISILNNIKSYKTIASIKKELEKVIKQQSFNVPSNLFDLCLKKFEFLEKQGLIEIGSRGKSKTIKKKGIISHLKSN